MADNPLETMPAVCSFPFSAFSDLLSGNVQCLITSGFLPIRPSRLPLAPFFQNGKRGAGEIGLALLWLQTRRAALLFPFMFSYFAVADSSTPTSCLQTQHVLCGAGGEAERSLIGSQLEGEHHCCCCCLLPSLPTDPQWADSLRRVGQRWLGTPARLLTFPPSA